MTDTQKEMVAALRSHALSHYEQNGWDFLVECWTDEEIAEEIGNTRTLRGCIAKIGPILRAQDEQRREVRSTIW